MADQSFALSPISARATQPSEEDYDAISEAFMETARGRWFLGEYAKRNRNADTRMVLDAVGRIEQTLAAQKAEPPDNRLAEALAAIGSAVEQARATTSVALDALALEAALAPVRKGARVIREISWRWREIGADGRICDLIDSQTGAIEAGCEQIASSDPRASLHDAFDLIRRELDRFSDGAAATAAVKEQVATAAARASAVTAAEPPAPTVRDTPARMADPAVSVEAQAPAAEPIDPVAYAHDEAVLDLIALEMAAPDPADTDLHGNEAYAEAPSSVEDAMVAPIDPALEAAIEPSPQPVPPAQPSLGSTLVASGIVRRPMAAASDPLAALRRLSQAEKIALFS